jgi:DNA-binding SARP family transcriptional activator
MMSRLHVSLLGRFDLTCDDQPVAPLEGAKAQELLSYLVLHAGRAHSREVLAALLWGDALTSQSRKYLRQTLWQLQAVLEPFAANGAPPLLNVETDWVRLNTDADFWSDVGAFNQACKLVSGETGRDFTPEVARTVEAAVELYQADLLEGWYAQEWCLVERERFRMLYLGLLDKLMAYSEANGAFEAGIEYGTRLLRQDYARERTHRQLMRLHYLAGDRSAALHQFTRCREVLRQQLDIEPSQRTMALYRQIQQDSFMWPSVTSGTEWSGSVTLVGQLLETMAQMRAELASLDLRLEQGMQAMQGQLPKLE